MQNVTLRMDEEFVETLDSEADERGLSRSDYIRNILKSRDDTNELQREIDALQRKNGDLRSQLQAANQRIDASNEIVEYVEEQRELESSREERRHANVLRRGWWWLAGTPEADDEP